MDELGIGVVGGDGGDGLDLRAAHQDRVALHMAEAGGVADHAGIEDLLGLILGHGPGDHPALGVRAG